MKTITAITVALLAAALAPAAPAMTIDEAFDALPAYEFGQDRTPLSVIAQALADAVNEDDAVRDALTARLAAILQGERSDEAARFICRQLGVFGREDAVEALTPLLHEPALAESALDALERNPSHFAGIALRQTVENATGLVRIGAIQALAARGDAGVNDRLLAIAAGDEPAQERQAALDALAKLGGADALGTLAQVAEVEASTLARAANQARLRIAERLGRAGKTGEARAVYDALAGETNPVHVRAAALGGLNALDPDGAEQRITSAFEESEAMRAVAVDLLREMPDTALAERFARRLDTFPAEMRLLLLAALPDIGARIPADTFAQLLESDEEAVQLAAIQAMPRSGGVDSVPLLVDTAVNQRRHVRRTAREVLVAMPGEGVDPALRGYIDCDRPEEAQEAMRALAGRGAAEAADDLLALLAADCPVLEDSAWNALGDLAGPGHVPELVQRLAQLADESVRPRAERTLAAAARRGAGSKLVLDAVDAAADPALLQSAVRIAGTIGDGPALAYLEDMAAADNEAIRVTALRALGGWPDLRPVPQLITAARSDDADARPVAVEGALRLLSRHESASPSQRAAWFEEVADQITEDNEKKLLLAGLGNLGHPTALSLIEQYADDPELAAEVNRARVNVAAKLFGAFPERVRPLLEELVQTGGEVLAQEAGTILAQLDALDGYITAWAVSGPYTTPSESGQLLFDVPFAPETGDPAVWRIMPMGLLPDTPFVADLGRFFGELSDVVYLRTRIESPGAQDATLELGTNDGVKVWLNDELIHAVDTGRPLQLGEDQVPVQLEAGTNTLLLKVYNIGGAWSAAARLVDAAGAPLQNLTYEAPLE